MKTPYLIALPLALSISGCTTVISPQQAAALDVNKTGLILATIGPSGVRPNQNYVDVELDLRRVGADEGGARELSIGSSRPFWLIRVPPGHYQISHWHLERSSQLIVTATHPFTFDVRPGEITYLGHFDVARVRRENPYVSQDYPRAGPVLEDHCKMAVAEFRKKYPGLGAVPVRDAAPQRFAWEPAAAHWVGVQVVNGESQTAEQNEWGQLPGRLRAASGP